jgi:hypothetical protein
MIYTYPICVIESGRYGNGYIYGKNHNLPDKPIHLINTPDIKYWHEEEMINVVISDNNYLIPLDREYKWDVVERWCKKGANIEFWMRQF